MIGDEKRREVAARLRENAGLAMRLPSEYSIEAKSALVLSKLLDCIDSSDDVFDVLADLIDRPTCTVDSDTPGFHIGVCSHCGAMVERGCAVFDATSALPTRFCPNCGAEVDE